MLIGWDRGHFLLITRALLAIKKAWLLDADWLSTPALSWFPASNGFRKGILETHRFWVWSKHGYFIFNNVKDNQHATKRSLLVEKQEDFSDYWFAALKTFEWRRLVLHETQKLIQNFTGRQTESKFIRFASGRLISITAHLIKVNIVLAREVFRVERTVLDARSY